MLLEQNTIRRPESCDALTMNEHQQKTLGTGTGQHGEDRTHRPSDGRSRPGRANRFGTPSQTGYIRKSPNS